MNFDFYLPYSSFSGSGYDLGFAIGQKFRKNIQTAYLKSFFLKKLQEVDAEDPNITDQLISLGERRYSKYIHEIRGLADGADLNVRNLFLMNFRHSFNLGCSSVLLKNHDMQKLYLGHNEDHEYYMARHSYLAKIDLDNGVSFLSHLYPGCLAGPSFWLNSYGIGITGNAINEPKKPIGIPKGLLDRAAVEVKNLSEALKILQTKDRSGGYGYNIFSLDEFSIFNLETTSKEYSIIPVNSHYVHTNHYIHPKFSDIQNKKGNSSYLRLKSLQNRINKIPINSKGIKELLLHDDVHVDLKEKEEKNIEKSFYGCTCCTAIFTIAKQRIHIEIIPNNQNQEKIMEFEYKKGIISIINPKSI